MLLFVIPQVRKRRMSRKRRGRRGERCKRRKFEAEWSYLFFLVLLQGKNHNTTKSGAVDIFQEFPPQRSAVRWQLGQRPGGRVGLRGLQGRGNVYGSSRKQSVRERLWWIQQRMDVGFGAADSDWKGKEIGEIREQVDDEGQDNRSELFSHSVSTLRRVSMASDKSLDNFWQEQDFNKI
eukprot:752637-Hanusia_phi.AAC.5